jgi:uncharacterized protein (TIGR02270 family)
MAGPTLTFIPDLLQEHLEELGFLWTQWKSGFRSPTQTLRSRRHLEERFRARLQGVLAVADIGLELIEGSLESEDSAPVFGAAYSLLHLGNEATASRIVDDFAAANDKDRLNALQQALAHAPLLNQLRRLWTALDSASSLTAVAAAVVLAFHGALRLTPEQLLRLLRDENSRVRRNGWRLISYLDTTVEPKEYAAAMRDNDDSVRAAALEAGAWCGVEGVLAMARQLARVPSPEHRHAYYLLAVLGTAEDRPILQQLVSSVALGPERHRLLGAYGSTELMEHVLAGLDDPDPATAAAAGAAFTKLTGIDVESERRAQVVPPGEEPDEFEAEFLEEVTLPDPELARHVWAEHQPCLANAGRLCRGLDVGRSLSGEAFDSLDMESRWELHLRSRYYGGWKGSPLELETFPQRA